MYPEAARPVLLMYLSLATCYCFGFGPPDFPDGVGHFSAVDKMNFDNFVRFWDKSICGDSCLSIRDNITTKVTLSSAHSCDGCFCDGCIVYGDCCLDKVLEGEMLTNSLLQYTSCTSPTQGFRDGGSEGSYILVTKCPVGYNDDIVRRNCENLPNQFETILNNPPVYSHKSQMNYLNSHCAECHNDFDNLTEWTSQITCRKPVKLSNIKTMDDLIILINTDVCGMFYPPKDSLSRRCQFNVSDTISECNVTGDFIDFNGDLEKACDMYVNPVTVDAQRYLNVFCALCNGKRSNLIKKWEKTQITPFDGGAPVPPFSIIFNLRPRQKLPDGLNDSKCPEGSVLIAKSTCRRLACSPGRIVLSHSCEDAFKTADGLAFRLRYHLLSTGQSTFLEIQDINTFWKTYIADIAKHYHHPVLLQALFLNVTMQICYQGTIVEGIVSVENVTTIVETIIGGDISQRMAELALLRLLQSEWEFRDTVWKTETVVSYNVSEVPLSGRGSVCRSFEIETWGKFSPDLLNDDLFIPLTPMTRCNQTELLPEEYSLNHTTGLLNTNVTGMEYEKGQYIIDGDRVRICLNEYNQETPAGTQKYQLFQINMQWVTTISMGVSIFCLFLTIAVCVAAKSRQTLPGKITIALVSTLIIAQLLFITSGQASRNLWGCRFVGMAIHYFWLAVFSWKQVAGYHMYLSFVHPFRKRLSNGITFVKYMSYAFGAPLLIVVCYTVTHVILSNKNYIGYGDDACFLSSPLDIGVTFVLPVSIVVVTNAFFFGRVVHVIKKMSEIEKHSNRANTNHSIIFVKMSLLLGFTWMFGFLANIANNHIMWYMFAAFNAGIGMFIFLGQVWNKRVLGHIRRAMDLDQKSESATSTTNSKL